jgi:Fur family transcriptional regulator, zinc uptake regulator
MMSAEFSQGTSGLLDKARVVCEQRGARLTELRRHVLGMILDSTSPVRAYELLDRLRGTRRGAAPPTVYRALEFLLEQNLIHRIERLSAFVGCVAGCTAAPHGVLHTHAVQFLICRSCGGVVEIENQEVTALLGQAAQDVGFSISSAIIEAEGLCSACRDSVAQDTTSRDASG